MPLQHYLPATHLASFSLADTGRRRDRKLASGDRRNGNTFESIAGNLGAIQNFYVMAVDDIWAAYESQLEQAVGDLVARCPTAMTWASVLVPFVACTFLRGPDFEERFRSRLENNLGPIPTEANAYINIDYARVMELQRILAPMAAAKWIVMRVQGQEDHRAKVRAHFRARLDVSDDELLTVRDVNVDGEMLPYSRGELLTHLLLHERGHHGDVSTLFYQLGIEPDVPVSPFGAAGLQMTYCRKRSATTVWRPDCLG